MIVSTCSFGSSGSSAVTDYLSECEDAYVFDKLEFSIVTECDGMEDLEYHLMMRNSRQSGCINAIQRFNKLVNGHLKGWNKRTGIDKGYVRKITDEYIDSLTQVRFKSFSPRIDKPHSQFLQTYLGNAIIRQRLIYGLEKRKIITKNVDFYPLDYVNISIKPENFYCASRKYLHDLLEGMGCDFNKRMVVLDQAFSGNDPAKSFPFFEDVYAIVVDRDPRDMYIFAKKVLLSKGRFMATDTVDDFIKYYRALRNRQPYKYEDSRILCLQFEDMVYNYENTADKIDCFLGIRNSHRNTVFVPEMSAANTCLIRKFPEFAQDIKRIEENLPEYLFDFSKHEMIESNNGMFFGKSLNRKQ